MSAPSCPFCDGPNDRIVRLWEDGEVKTFTPFGPPTGPPPFGPPFIPGHTLVVPRRHVRDAAEDPETTAQVFSVVTLLAREVGPCNIIANVGHTATQSVFHLHVHVVPRRPGDGLKLPWTEAAYAAAVEGIDRVRAQAGVAE